MTVAVLAMVTPGEVDPAVAVLAAMDQEMVLAVVVLAAADLEVDLEAVGVVVAMTLMGVMVATAHPLVEVTDLLTEVVVVVVAAVPLGHTPH